MAVTQIDDAKSPNRKRKPNASDGSGTSVVYDPINERSIANGIKQATPTITNKRKNPVSKDRTTLSGSIRATRSDRRRRWDVVILATITECPQQ